MANGQGSIDEIIGQQAIKGLDDSIAKMEALNKEFASIVPLIKSMNSALTNTNGIKDYNKAVQDQEPHWLRAQKAVQSYTVAVAESKQVVSTHKREMDNHMKGFMAEEGSINELRATLAKLQMDYDKMGAANRKAFGSDLLANIQKTDTALKSLEATTGRHQRNVGNYGQAVFSLSQVFREMPSFAYSASQGILAVSNNLPILVDNFQMTAKAVNDTTGKINGVSGALGIFAKSIFSFGNIFTIAISLLTVFMARMEMSKNRTKETKDKVDELNRSLGNEIGVYETLSRVINSNTTSYKQKIEAAKELLKMQPKILEGYSAEEIAAGKASIAIDKIKNSVLALAHAKHLQTQVDAAVSKQYDLDAEKYQKQFELSELYRQRTIINRRMGLLTPGSNQYDIQNQLFIDNNEAIESTKEAIRFIGQDVLAVNKLLDSLTNKIAQYKSSVDPNVLDKTTNGKSGAGRSAGADKAVNRIDEIENQYKLEQALLDTNFNLKLISEEAYYTKSVNLAYSYIAKRENLTKEETESEILLNKDLSEATSDYFDKYLKYLQANLKDHTDAEKAKLDAHIQTIKDKMKWDDMYTDYVKGQLDAQDRMFDEEERQRRGRIKDVSEWIDAASGIGTALADIGIVGVDRELAAIETRDKRLKEYYDNEMRFIEQSGFSSAKKEKMKQKLEAETEAKRKQLDRERITALRKQAIFQKGIDVMNIISKTAIAIMEQGAVTPTAVAAGIIGALQIAKVLATPIPQYAKGRKGGKQEWAVVGEQGSEIISHNGTMQLTPNTPTLTLLPEGADVIPHHEAIKNAAYIHLSKQGQITTDKLQAALIEKFEQYHEDNLVLQSILRSKDFKYNHKDLSGYEAWRQTKVR